jgi:hypothetical protein
VAPWLSRCQGALLTAWIHVRMRRVEQTRVVGARMRTTREAKVMIAKTREVTRERSAPCRMGTRTHTGWQHAGRRRNMRARLGKACVRAQREGPTEMVRDTRACVLILSLRRIKATRRSLTTTSDGLRLAACQATARPTQAG